MYPDKLHHSLQKPLPHRQGGASLLMVLIFMLVLSLLAIFSVRNASLLEKQARNEQEYQLARQAAEAALRDAETDLRLPDPDGDFARTGASCSRAGSPFRERGVASTASAEFTDTCLLGQCGLPAARYAISWAAATTSNRGAAWWPNTKGGLWGNNATSSGAPNFDCSTATGGVPLGTYTGVPALTRVARQPEYLIEFMPPGGTSVVESRFECTSRTPGSAGLVYSAENEGKYGKGGTGAAKGACYVFRITARGFGLGTTNDSGPPNPRVEVVLQSYFQLFVK